MSWYTKSCVFLTPLLFTATAMAARIDFNGASQKASLSVTPIASNAEVAPVRIELSVPGLDVTPAGDGFDEVKVEGLEPLQVEGSPALFTTGSLLAVPEGYEPVLTVEKETVREVNGVVAMPMQKKYRCDVGTNAGFKFNSALYESRSTFPARSYGLEEVGRMQGLRLVRVALNPVQMDMASRSLKVTTEFVAHVTFTKVRNANKLVLPQTFFEIARNVTANGRSVGTEILMSRAPEKMLAVVADSLMTEAAPLFDWKRSRGLSVDVVTLTQAGGTKEKVKEYIQHYYDTAAVKPTYLFFVGNKTTMPAFSESTGSGSAASDWRYATLSGTDDIPDALYGRILADNGEEVTHQVNRQIAYEKSPQKGGDWYSKAFTIASSEGSGPSDKEYAEQVRAALKAGTYTDFDVFLQGDSTATPTNILESLNKGRTWISYFGHGSGTSWGSTVGSFNTTHVSQATNGDKLPIIIDVACLNASWVNIAKPFGKAWVTGSTGGKEAGAVAFLGGSVSISWHPPAVMSVGIAKYHFEKPVQTLGGSVLAGQLYLVEKMGTGEDVSDNLKWYNLFGDPSMLIRTATPKAYQLKHAVRRSSTGVTVTVTAVDDAGKGVQGLTAAIGAGTEPLAVGQTDAQGNAVLAVSGVGQLAPNTRVTTTGYNAETQQALVQ